MTAKRKKAKKSAIPSALNKIDVVFLLDVTGSMGPYIAEAKRMVADITKKIQTDNDLDIRIALAVYRDHPPQDYSFTSKGHDFVTPDEFTALLTEYYAAGGGDFPEAVYDGINEVFGFSWRRGSDRAVYLIGDAPPHKNCICQLTPKKLIAQLKRRRIQLNAHSIANHKETTEAFKEFVDATNGTLTVGNRPEHTSGWYTASMTMKSSDISTAHAFMGAVASAGVSYSSADMLSSDDITTVATTAGLSETEAKSTIEYLKKRGL